jgi:hypothetical protein
MLGRSVGDAFPEILSDHRVFKLLASHVNPQLRDFEAGSFPSTDVEVFSGDDKRQAIICSMAYRYNTKSLTYQMAEILLHV